MGAPFACSRLTPYAEKWSRACRETRNSELCLHGSTYSDSGQVLSISAAQKILINGARIISRARLVEPRYSILRRNSSIQKDLILTPRPAYERPKSKDGLGPKKRLWFPVTSPVCRNSQNPTSPTTCCVRNPKGRLRREKQNVSTVVTESCPGSQLLKAGFLTGLFIILKVWVYIL